MKFRLAALSWGLSLLIGLLSLLIGLVGCESADQAIGSGSSNPSISASCRSASEVVVDLGRVSSEIPPNACISDEFLPSVLGVRITPQRPDRDLRRILREIDSNELEATVRKLVSFGTRHTLS